MVGMTSRSVTTPALRVESEVSDPASPAVRRTGRSDVPPRKHESDAARPWRRSSPARAWSRRRRPARIRRRPTSPSRRSCSPPLRVHPLAWGRAIGSWTFCSPGRCPASPSVGNPFCSVISAAPPLVARAATSGIAEHLLERDSGDQEDEDFTRFPRSPARVRTWRRNRLRRRVGSRSAPRRARVTTGPGSVRARGGRPRRAPPAWPPSPGSRGRRGTCPRSRSRRRR